MISREDIEKLGELSRISISDDEKDELMYDLARIVEYVSQIQMATGEENILAETRDYGHLVNTNLRNDDNPHESGLYTSDLMAEAPDTKNGYLKVKKILG